MFHFLGCFFVLILGIFLLCIAFVGTVLNHILSFLGLTKRPTRNGQFSSGPDGFGPYGFTRQQGNETRRQDGRSENERDNDRNGRTSEDQQHHNAARQSSHKIFEKDDSEYVSFEEI